MLGSRKRAARQAEGTLAVAQARIETAEAQLAGAPADPGLLAELREAHNAVADLLAAAGSGPPAP